jgi:SAM-dependent methyltransferase
MQRVAGLLRVTEDDPEYRRLAEAEAEFWRRPHPFGVESLETITREGPVDRYMNARLTGDPGVRWQETIARHGTFRRGLMLGTTALGIEADILRTNPALHLTFVDLSEGPLRRRVELLGQRFPGRVDTRVADLNFLALPPESYDLVVSSSTLHHVTNLEHLAHQIDRTLTPEGVFFLQDYVGEARCTPSPAKKRVFELVYERDIARQRGRQSGLVWKDPSDLSPFCGVRSHEILEAMRAHLREEEVRTAGSLLVALLRTEPVDLEASVARWARWRFWLARLQMRFARRPPDMLGEAFRTELCTVGDVASDAGLLAPGVAFARYRKRSA